jgi:hypothetical protein
MGTPLTEGDALLNSGIIGCSHQWSLELPMERKVALSYDSVDRVAYPPHGFLIHSYARRVAWQ